jgi:DNA polymerase family A
MAIFDLRFSEIWIADTEYYPGPGLANGGRHGDAITPLCLVALEMRSGRCVRLWQDQLGPFPPYHLDGDAVLIVYGATAEPGFHLAARWGRPVNLIDLLTEFRMLTNDARIKSGDRPKGFHSLANAVHYFRLDEMDVGHKADMRDRILQGPPFTRNERRDILAYCEDDTRNTARVAERLIPLIPSLEHALYRGKTLWPFAEFERRGNPIDLPHFERTRAKWDAVKSGLVEVVDTNYDCYEIVGGAPHFREASFEAYLRRQRITWPRRDSGELDLRGDTFTTMAQTFPQITPLRELRSTLSKMRQIKLAIGNDGRNRTPFWPYGTKTARCAPSNSEFLFGPAKWIRFWITPPPGFALVARDFDQQEVRIAAVISHDSELQAACESGDVYLGVAKRLGMAPSDATPLTHRATRNLFKTVVLGILYGLGAPSLAMRANISRFEAHEILARLRSAFRKFFGWCADVINRAGLALKLTTNYGWTVDCPPGSPFRTLRNWPIQSTASSILHAAALLADRRGIRVLASIHDAFLAEGPIADIRDVSAELDRAMRDASRLVLEGYELTTSIGGRPDPEAGRPWQLSDDVILPGDRYYDDRGVVMWNTVNELLEKQKRRSA